MCVTTSELFFRGIDCSFDYKLHSPILDIFINIGHGTIVDKTESTTEVCSVEESQTQVEDGPDDVYEESGADPHPTQQASATQYMALSSDRQAPTTEYLVCHYYSHGNQGDKTT